MDHLTNLLVAARDGDRDALERFVSETQGDVWRLDDQIQRTTESPLAIGDPTGRVDLGDLLATLDDDRRSAFVLTQVLGLHYDEAAEILECPIGTVRSRVSRAPADLVEMMDDESTERDAVG